MVKVAEQETDRLVRLINDMLDLAKIEARALELKKDWCPVKSLLEKTALGLKGFASASQVSIQVEKGTSLGKSMWTGIGFNRSSPT